MPKPPTRKPCPQPQCSAADPEQVHMPQEGLAIAGIDGDWTANAMRCTYCGTIYSTESEGERTLRGYFGGSTIWEAENWRPFT